LGTTFVGVFASENGENGAVTSFHFFYIDQDADPTSPSNWMDDSLNIPGPMGVEMADDHVSAARDPDGNAYFAVKTEGGAPTDPLIEVFKRTPDGVWSRFKVTETQEVPEQSRPSLVIDEENRELYVYTNDVEHGDANRIKVSLDSLGDLATEPLTVMFDGDQAAFGNVITPRHRVDTQTGIVVLAQNNSEDSVWFGAETRPDFEVGTSCSRGHGPGGASLNFQIDVENTGDVALTVDIQDTLLGVHQLGVSLGLAPAGGCQESDFDSNPSIGCYRIEGGIVATRDSLENEVTVTATALTDFPDVPFEAEKRASAECEVAEAATRGKGFWKTHEDYACHVFESHLGGSAELGWRGLADCDDVFGILWANPGMESDGDPRDQLCRARVQGSAHLLAAILNAALDNGAEQTPEGEPAQDVIDALLGALDGGKLSEIQRLKGIVADYNESRDEAAILDEEGTVVRSADPNAARARANLLIADCTSQSAPSESSLDSSSTTSSAAATSSSSGRGWGACGIGFELVFVLPPLLGIHRRRRSERA
jgi:hypothetical protein